MSGDGVVAHNRRTYFAENVDPTRTHLNVEYCYTPIEEAYHQLFDAALAEFNAKQKRKDRCIENYYEKIRDGKQEKPFYEVIFQVGNKDDMGTAGENAELAKTILDKFYRSFLERNPQLHVYSAHLHMDEATPHLHIDFIPFTTGSKRGLSTRVSLKQALADQGITGEGRSLTERDLWVQKEKEALAEIMLEHGIEWEQKGEHKEHLSVLEFKREKRKEELAELEQSIERVQQQQVSIQAVEQIEAKPLPLTSKVAVDREDYQNLVTAAQKYVVQEKQEGKLKKLLKEAKKTISDLKAKIQSLTAELSAVKAELAQYKSVRGKLRTADLEQENSRLRSKIRSYESTIERNDLWLPIGKLPIFTGVELAKTYEKWRYFMKTGLTKKQKTTSIFFTDADDMIEVCTRNTPLKNRLATFAEEYPSECRLIDDDENGRQTYEIRKGRFGFKLTPPYSQERKQAASRLAKNNIENLRRTTK